LSVFEIIFLTITLVMGFSIVWSTLTLGISPMPSSKKARQAMLELSVVTSLETGIESTSQTQRGAIFELGSGWGSLLIPLAKMYPHRKIVGYELSILPWFTTVILIKVLGLKNVKVHHQNFLKADLSGASVAFCYLYPGGMKALEDKLKLEHGALEYLISNNFSLPSSKPIKTILLNDLYQSPIYLYKFK